MSLSDICIRRPVFATVLSLIIVLLGLLAYQRLAVREYPNIDVPIVTVNVMYPGASPEIMESQVAQPVEDVLSGIEGLDFVSSISRSENTQITAQFRLGTDSDEAANDVRDRLGRVRSLLPDEIDEPMVQKVEADAQPVIWLAFYSERFSAMEITDLIERVVQDRLQTIPGVSEVLIRGARTYAMRIWLDPEKLAAHDLTVQDVEDALRRQNVEIPAGRIESVQREFSVLAETDLQTPEEFNQLILDDSRGYLLRLADVGHAEIGAADERTLARFNGRSAVAVGMIKQATANPLDISDGLEQALPSLRKLLPEGMEMQVSNDNSQFIRESIDNVYTTIWEAVLLVILIIFLFLRSLRATLIPLVTIPVSLIGACALMALMGFSINTLTLLAMVLAIGLVVDDAIVVVENIHRHIEEGKTPLDAAIEGAREIAVPVVSMTITLAAVYAPIGFLEGLTGALFKEFALTLAGAVIISGIVALTLSPMMCAKLLRHEENPSGLAHRLDQLFERLKRRYQRALHSTLEMRPVVLVFGLIVMLLIPAFLAFSTSELAPEEDQGIVFLIANAPQPSNLNYLNAYTADFVNIFKSFPEYYSSFQINGSDGVQAGIGGFLLKPWGERERTQMELLPLVQARLDQIPGLQIFGFNLPSLPGTGDGLPFQFVINTPNDYETLLQVAERIKQRAMQSGQFAFLNVDLAFDKPEIVVDIDRQKAAQMGVSMQDLGSTLATLLGEGEINRFTIDGRSYKVIAQVERAYRDNPGWLNSYYVKSSSGEMVPLGTLISLSERARPSRLKQFQQLNAATLEGVPIVSMGEALATVQRIAREEAPRGYGFDQAGSTRQFVQEGNALYLTFALALAIIFLVLAAQFESFRDPLVILITVPLSICGALIPIFLGFSSMNIYTQVGLVTLIGLISKHGILIVEFANQLRHERGLSVRQAIEDAAAIRLRPVLMTTAAMVFAMLPLIFASGAGAVSRFDIGLVIATGMTVGTAFTLFVLPCVYTLLAKPDKPPVGQAQTA